MPGAHALQGEYSRYFSNTEEEGMTFCEQGPVSFFSQFSF